MGGKKLSPSSSKVGTTSSTTSAYSSGSRGSSGGRSSGSKGAYSSGSGGSSGGRSSGSKGVSYDDVLKQATLRLNTPVAGNNRITNSLYGAQGALKYIINSGLSEANQKKMARQLGLI